MSLGQTFVGFLADLSLRTRRLPIWLQCVVGSSAALFADGLTAGLCLWLGSSVEATLTAGALYYIAILLIAFLTRGRSPTFATVVTSIVATGLPTNTSFLDDGVRALVFVTVAFLMMEVVEAGRAAQRSSKAREQEAIAAVQTRDTFLAAVTHDLRQPLAGIELWIKVLRRDPYNHENVERAADAIENCSRQQKRLVMDLLDIARLAAGKVQLQTMPVQLDNILGDACDLVAPAAEIREVKLTYPTQTNIRILADRGRLQQVFWNLISNAVKFTERGGAVDVTVSMNGDHQVYVKVRDTGIGISADAIPHVFDPYWQATPHGTGIGLGLMIVRRMVEMHGGSVSAKSLGLGQGAEFLVTLPVGAVKS